MNLFRPVFKKIIFLLLFSIPLITNAQVVNNGSLISNSSNSIFFVNNGSLTNNGAGARIENKGDLKLTGNTGSIGSFRNLNTAIYSNTGKTYIENNYTDSANNILTGSLGSFIFNGTNNQSIISRGNLNRFNTVLFTGGGIKSLNGRMIVQDSFLLDNGRLNVNNIDTLIIDSTGKVFRTGFGSGSVNSYVNGTLVIKGMGDLYYPIGRRIATSDLFNPIALTAVPNISGMPTIAFNLKANNFGVDGGGIDMSNPGFKYHWKMVNNAKYQGSPVQTFFNDPSDFNSAVTISELAVAQTDSIGVLKKWYGIGQSSNNSNSLTSASNVTAKFISIGSCKNLKLRISAFLEGPYISSGLMQPINNDTLNKYYGSIGLLDQMFPNTTVPINAVDVITILITQTVSPYSIIDSSKAWLMNDGSIRDYYTGSATFITYCTPSTVNGNYYVLVKHRNHLAIMSAASVNVKSNQLFTGVNEGYVDLTGMAAIFGGGVQTLDGTNVGMYAGNARNLGLQYEEVNALDLYDVIRDQNLLLTGYQNVTDVNLDLVVNSTDFTKTLNANDNLYFSTVR